jgi:hypothetical protein
MIKQISSMRVRFSSYENFAKATFNASFKPEEIADAYVVKSECFASSYIENMGDGKFIKKDLPAEAQIAPVYGMITGDQNDDGNLDILMAGNSYATEASTGHYDAMTGLLLKGNGNGNFTPVKSAVTGFKADGDVKSLVQIISSKGKAIVLAGNNSAPMEAYELIKDKKIIPVKNTDCYAIINKRNGQSYRHEFYYGSNYLSQTSRTLQVGKDVKVC